MTLDLNCDLGEGEPIARTRALMRAITSANVACGGHAGNTSTMESCVRLCRQFGVNLGAHPGPWSRADFGRKIGSITPDELELLLVHQVSALERIASAQRVRLHHVKLHGALYHASDNEPALARRYLDVMKRWWPACIVYARAGGRVVGAAYRAGVKAWPEVFGDRAYREDGTLVPRDEPGAIIRNSATMVARIRLMRESGEVETISGHRLCLSGRTICVHSDTANSVALVRRIRKVMDDGK